MIRLLAVHVQRRSLLLRQRGKIGRFAIEFALLIMKRMHGEKRLPLARIAHKSLEICEQSGLKQKNRSATPTNSSAFSKEISKLGCIQIQISNFAIKQTRMRLFNSLLTRIDRIDFSKRGIDAG